MSKNFGKKIICPKCGTQYLPGEIYLPKQFLGQPKYVERDFSGKILFADGGDMCLKETYMCDKCDTIFEVVANIQFNTKEKEKLNVKKPFKMELKPKLILSEK